MLNYIRNDLKTDFHSSDPNKIFLKFIEYLYLSRSNIYHKSVKVSSIRKLKKLEILKASKKRGIDVDQPRNLAKSVTVE